MNLTDLPQSSWSGLVYRLQGLSAQIQHLRDMGLEARDVDEMIELLRGRGDLEDLQSVLNKPFETRSSPSGRRTRFSDGSIRVFYSAMELDTAREEMKHYEGLQCAVKGASTSRSVYYQEISCQFNGSAIIDLRPHLDSMPYLVQEGTVGYKDCNRVGAEAKSLCLDGLLTPSARRFPDGTCTPVFQRSAIDNPIDEGACEFFYDAGSKTVVIRPL